MLHFMFSSFRSMAAFAMLFILSLMFPLLTSAQEYKVTARIERLEERITVIEKKLDTISAKLENTTTAPAPVLPKTIQATDGKFYKLTAEGKLVPCEECNVAGLSVGSSCPAGNCPNGQCSPATTYSSASYGTLQVGGGCGSSASEGRRGPIRTIIGFPIRVIRSLLGGCGG